MAAKAIGKGSKPKARRCAVVASAFLLMPALVCGCASTPQPSPARKPALKDAGLILTKSEVALELANEISTPAIPPAVQEYPIDLTTALRLAEAENPLIAEAWQRIGEALAIRLGARALLLPSLNVGTNFRDHTGDLQRPSGRILSLNEKSLYFGGGAGAWGTGTVQVPAVNIFSPLTDAIFEPLAAKQQVVRAQFDATATANTILLEVAELHVDLLAAEADLKVLRESATQAAEVARLTRAYAQAGQGREADAQRAASELALLVDEVRQAEEDFAVAAARLSRRLHLDQSVRLRPIPPPNEILTIVDPAVPLPDLIQIALQGRPEFRARTAALAAAELHHQQEQYRPLLPTLWLGFSGGVMGGGSNLTGPELAHFGGRSDFDVMALWTLRNFGMGNLAIQKQRLAEAGRAAGEQSRVIAEIRSQVGASYAAVIAARQQVDITTRQLNSAESGFAEDLRRIRNTVGRPLEVVNSLQLLNDARVARIRAVADHNKAEFQLFVNLGSPPPLVDPSTAPMPPAPVAAPPLPPLAGLGAT